LANLLEASVFAVALLDALAEGLVVELVQEILDTEIQIIGRLRECTQLNGLDVPHRLLHTH